MQQKFCSRGSGSSLLPERNASSCCVSSGHNAAVFTSSSTNITSSLSHLPFRCPRCGEQERFRSLSSLRAHLEYRHSYTSCSEVVAPPPPPPDPAPAPPTGAFSITGQIHSQWWKNSVVATSWSELSLPARRGPFGSAPSAAGDRGGRGLHVRSLSDCRESCGGAAGLHHRASSTSYGSERRRTQSVGTQAQEEEPGEEEDEEDEEEEEEEEEDEETDEGRKEQYDPSHHHHRHRHHPPFGAPPSDPPPAPEQRPERPPEAMAGPVLYPGLETGGSASAAVGRRLAQALRCADTSMQRRLATVSTELAHTDTQLLCQRAHWRHLARERQEVAERERSLSRQVDVAVMVIAALREQLNASENELERREREVLTIQKFLEAAARQESCGKVRIQRFIENLLKRIALAERLLQYYQDTASPPPQYNHYSKQQSTDSRPHRTSKSRSAGGQLSSSSGLRDNRSHSSSQFSRSPRDRDKENREQRRDGEREQERSHRDRLAQSSRLFCRPEHRDDIWNPQHHQRSVGYEA